MVVDQILKVFEENEQVKASSLVDRLDVDRSTVYRNLKKLLDKNKIQKIKKGVYKLTPSIDDFFDKPVWDRPEVQYDKKLLRDYKPNETYFLSKVQRSKLQKSIDDISIDTDFYKNNKDFVETMLIDLSYASSHLEGNTYSYLDTEVLLKYNEIAKDKQKKEAQMILNHKKAIEYLIYYKNDLNFTKKTFGEIQQLLCKNLLEDKYLGVFRDIKVQIGSSAYNPIDDKAYITKEFNVFIEKLKQIQNPFEQSLFILTFVPYFQAFKDGNKRTSRMMAQLPLLKYNLPLLSLIKLKKKIYISSILAVYELGDVSRLADIYVQNYTENISRYKNML